MATETMTAEHDWAEARLSAGSTRLRWSYCRSCHMVVDSLIPFRHQYQAADGSKLGMLHDEPTCEAVVADSAEPVRPIRDETTEPKGVKDR